MTAFFRFLKLEILRAPKFISDRSIHFLPNSHLSSAAQLGTSTTLLPLLSFHSPGSELCKVSVLGLGPCYYWGKGRCFTQPQSVTKTPTKPTHTRAFPYFKIMTHILKSLFYWGKHEYYFSIIFPYLGIPFLIYFPHFILSKTHQNLVLR